MRIVGLMSGTSADGIDAVLVDVRQVEGRTRLETLAQTTFPIPEALRGEILAACRPETGRVDQVCRLNALLGEWFARATFQVVELARLPIEAVDLIASHGQTIYHATQPGQDPPSTLQIAEPAVIAERTGRTVVADFRPRDVAAGGQGAPLMSYVDYLLFADPNRSRSLQNIGGIANLTFLPASGGPNDVIAFDSGPGNMVIDALCQSLFGVPYDRDGQIAASGRVDEALLAELLEDPYFGYPLPKTTGREQFGTQFARLLQQRGRERGIAPGDIVATATMLTARSIAQAYRRFLPPVDEVIVSGGGASNSTLMGWIQAEFRRLGLGPVFQRPEDLGISADAKEALGFAVLGFQTVHGRVGTLPAATGARHPVVLGAIVPGLNYLDLLRQVAADTVPFARPWRDVEQVVEQGVADGAFPGAALLVGRSDRIEYARGFGRLTADPDSPSVDLDTLYDLASLTKVIATTTATMILVEEARLDLDAPVSRYLPAFASNGKDSVRIRDLLLHCSGLSPVFPGGFVPYATAHQLPRDRDAIVAEVCAQPLIYPTGERSSYSDLGIIALGAVLEGIAGERLDRFVARRVFEPLGMASTLFGPSPTLWARVAPTERDAWRGHLVRGEVHDECAWMMGGVAPHAGLFSTARDLGRFGQMLLNQGELDGQRIVRAETLAYFVRRDGTVPESTRALGWDTASPTSSSGPRLSPDAFGHTGFTGTSVWVDPRRDRFVVFLTNRVYPTRRNLEILRIRPRLHNAVVEVVERRESQES